MLYHGAASAITPAFLTGDDGRSVQGLVVLLAKMCLQVSRKMCLSAPPDAMCRRWCASGVGDSISALVENSAFFVMVNDKKCFRLQIGSLTLASRKRRRSSNSSSTRARMHVREIIPGAGPRVLVTVSGLRHGMLDLRFRHPATVPLELVRAFCSVGCSRRTCGHFRT